MHSIDSYLIDNLPIQINGNEKYATGLTKKTTIDDVKYAILSCSLNKNETSTINLNDYAIFERWQGNERILDGKLKIYKLIRLWKSLPGNQLDHVKFIIKKRKNIYLPQQQSQPQQQQLSCNNKNNTASPLMNKTWNSNKVANALRKSTRDRSRHNDQLSASSSSSSRESSIESSQSNNDELMTNRYDKRYSSIRKFNRSKRSTICKNDNRREEFLNLVAKQNDIIEKQKHKIENNDKLIKKCVKNCLNGIRSLSSSSRSKSLDKYDEQQEQQQQQQQESTKTNNKRLANKSRERSSSIRRLIVKDASVSNIEVPEVLRVTSNDIKQTFENVLDDKQLQEYANLCNNYFKLQKNIKLNKNQIEKLNTELSTVQQQNTKETHQKIQTSLQTYDKQNEKLTHLNDALNRIDEIILLKTNLIKSLETELKKIEDDQLFDLKTTNTTNGKKLSTSTSTSSTISSFSSSSSILTSVSEQAIQQLSNNNNNSKTTKLHFGDNDSDTGISSANSDDFTTQLETLV